MLVIMNDLVRLAEKLDLDIDELVYSAIAQDVTNWIVVGETVKLGYSTDEER